MNSDNAVRYLRLGPYDIRLSCSALTDAIVASELDALQATMNNRLANTQKLTPAIRSMLTTTGASEWIDLIYHVYTRACHCNSNQTITIK
jgi:hypothetical protein